MARSILILFVLAGVLVAPGDLSSCGPFLVTTLFSSIHRPFDDARYYDGHLDIIMPNYERIYLMAAYRYLSGIGLTAEDQNRLVTPSSEPDIWNEQRSPAVQEWLKARVQVGAPPIDRIPRFSVYEGNRYIVTCGEDAFRNAALTFNEHFREGRSHDDLRAWVNAQDEVFVNCSGPSQSPPPAPAGAEPWMRADRAYQIAAAEFYAGDFDQAEADFRKIAEDRSSPWHGIAPYLAARALIRKTTLVDAAAAPTALEQLRRVLAEPDAARWHQSARDLMRYLRIQTDPEGAREELAHSVETRKTGVADEMNDLRLVLDRLDSHPQQTQSDSDMLAWIAAMEHDSSRHPIEKWRATGALPWLVAALTWAEEPDATIMEAARRVPEDSPAYLTVQLHWLRLMPPDEARPRLDAMLRRKLPVPVRNTFLAERMRLARDWQDLFRYAPRTAAGNSYEGFRSEPAKGKVVRYFDQDGARILDRQASLSVLRQAAGSPLLPANLRLATARAAWVRSIMMDDTGSAKEIAPVLASAAPYLKPYLDGYLKAPNERTRTFEAAWLLLNNPGMGPSIGAGQGRETPDPRIDNLRDNWWLSQPAVTSEPPNAPLQLLYRTAPVEAAFLTSAERAQVLRERDQLRTFPAATTFMARQAVEWSTTHPDDTRAPESLRLAIRAVRYSFTGDAQTNRWSKRAFQLLHSRYPNSEAARRTPYWYRATIR